MKDSKTSFAQECEQGVGGALRSQAAASWRDHEDARHQGAALRRKLEQLPAQRADRLVFGR
jgi:hypothetical protein